MSNRELERVEMMGRVKNGDLKLTDAAILLELSYRQVKRVWRCYREKGSEGLKHGHAGQSSNHRKPSRVRRQALNLIKRKYSGSERERFGPTLAAEHLGEEDGLVLDHETLRRWMLEEGLWNRQRKRQAHRQRRERKAHFGELVQLDGSFQILVGRCVAVDSVAPHFLDQSILMNSMIALHSPLSLGRIRWDDPNSQLLTHASKLRDRHFTP